MSDGPNRSERNSPFPRGEGGQGVRSVLPAAKATAWLTTPLPGIAWRVLGGIVQLRSERLLRTLSSASCGGGMNEVRDVINVHVSRTYNSARPEDDLRAVARDLGIEGDFVGLLTAVYVEKAALASRTVGDLTVCCLGTAGVGNATCPGREVPWDLPSGSAPRPGTINLVVVVDAELTPEAMVNLVITATEAKTLALFELGARTSAGEIATGTSTDTVVVACTGVGPRQRYGGPATLLGHLVAQCVREVVTASLSAPEPASPAASPFDAR